MPHTEKANHAAESTPLLRGGQPLKPYRRGRVARVITRVTVVGGFLLIALVAILNLVLPRVHIPSRVAPTSYNIQAALAAYAGDSLGNLYPTTIADWAELVRIVNAHGSALKPNAADMYIKSIQYASDGCDYRLTITTTDKRVTPPNNTFVVTPEGVARGAQEPQDLLGCTALMRAVMQGDVATVHALLQAGADVQARDQQGRTALMIAAARGSSIVHAILQAGADVQARDQQGRTALMDIPQLQAGADVHA